jgi:hypothetical protein
MEGVKLNLLRKNKFKKLRDLKILLIRKVVIDVESFIKND